MMETLWTNNGSFYGGYRTRTFAEVFPTYTDFLDFYKNGAFPQTVTEQHTEWGGDIHTVYYLLLSRYANHRVASSDEERFKFDLMATIFKYGPTWAKKLEIQYRLCSLTADEIQAGSEAIYNSADHPGKALDNDNEILKGVNQQNRTRYVKSKVEAYGQLWATITADVTEEFLSKFKKLFTIDVYPSDNLWYEIPAEYGGDN